MLIGSYGLFWREDEVNWEPRKGSKGEFRLLGKRPGRALRVRLADMRHQKGIYILYSDYGPHYVGLTKQLGLGWRLKQHRHDRHRGKWDRFSWFGFCHILVSKDEHGFCKINDLARAKIDNPSNLISDVEALLICAMGLRNIRQMNFRKADEWMQVKKAEVKQLNTN